jgi:outer membrane protein assembly factor BamB
VADDPTLPDSWTDKQNVVWTQEIPGWGWSSPVVWDDHVFVTSTISDGAEDKPEPGLYFGHVQSSGSAHPHRWMLYDVDFQTGKIRWQAEVRRMASGPPKMLKNTYASETPVTDGERVYAYFASGGTLAAYDMKGKLVWSREIGPYKTRFGWGTGASPALHGERIYIVNDNDERSFIAAFHKRTGAQIWRADRPDEGTNWSTPYIWENDQRTEIVTTGTRMVRSYDLEGNPLWEVKRLTTIHIPTPYASNGLLYVNSGFIMEPRRPVFAIRPGASGDISLKEGETANRFIAWFQPQLGTYNTSSLVYGDYYYALHDRGFLLCNDAKTGKPVYSRQRITSEASGFSASPWAYNGKIFAASEDGDTFVIQAGREFKVLGKNSLGGMIMATPAIAHGSLLIRAGARLYRIANKTAAH